MNLAKLTVGISAASFIAVELRKKTLAAAQPEYELCLIQVVFRHGARTPLHVPSYLPAVYYEKDLLVHSPKTYVNYRLVSTSGGEVGDSPYEKSYRRRGQLNGGCFPGQLTRIGADQMLRLGLNLRRRYLEEKKFLKPSYQQLSENLYTRSTNIERTIMSARCVLAGILNGESGEDALDIHISPSNEEIMYPNYFICDKLKYLTSWVLDKPEKIHGVQDIRELIRQLLDLPSDVMLDLVALRDNLVVETTHHKPSLLNELDDLALKKLEDGAMKIMTSAFVGVETVRSDSLKLAIGPFVDILMSNMENVRDGNNSSSVKMLLYSGHDTTLFPLLSALGMQYSEWPPYASHVILELLRKSNGTDSGGYYVRLLYNWKEQTVGQCSSAICPLEEFQKAVENVRLSHKSYIKQCAVTS